MNIKKVMSIVSEHADKVRRSSDAAGKETTKAPTPSLAGLQKALAGATASDIGTLRGAVGTLDNSGWTDGANEISSHIAALEKAAPDMTATFESQQSATRKVAVSNADAQRVEGALSDSGIPTPDPETEPSLAPNPTASETLSPRPTLTPTPSRTRSGPK